MEARQAAPEVDTALLGPCRDGVVVVDTETTGLRAFHGDRPFAVGLANTDGKTRVVYLDQPGARPKLEDVLQNAELAKVGHNIRFDMHMLKAAGLPVRGPVVDTLVLAQLVEPGLRSYKLKDLAKDLLGLTPHTETELKGWMLKENRRRRSAAILSGKPYKEANYGDVPRSILEPYLRDDLEYTVRLYFALHPVAKRKFPGILEMETKLTRVFYEMEQRGVRVDVAYLNRMRQEAAATIAKLEREMLKITGRPIAWRSGKQLGEQLLGRFKLKCVKRTDKGAPCFDSEALPLYDHPLATAVLEARKWDKLEGTYFGGLVENAANGLIHPSFQQHGAITGRASCRSPNLQNIPRRDKSVRTGFVCRPGFVTLFMDYSQIEFKLIVHYAEDAGLIEAFKAGKDVHKDTANLLFGKADAARYKDLRSVAKTLNYALPFGTGPRKLRRQLRKRLLEESREAVDASPTLRALANISETEARVLMNKYFRAYPVLRRYMKDIQRTIYRAGHVKDEFGKPYYVEVRKAYMAANWLVQGTAANIMKRGMVRLAAACRKLRLAGTPSWLTNTIHDEFQVEIDAKAWATSRTHIVRTLVEAVEDRETFRMPITVDVSVSTTNWAEKADVKE